MSFVTISATLTNARMVLGLQTEAAPFQTLSASGYFLAGLLRHLTLLARGGGIKELIAL
jgi:hypothetical protein